MDEGGSRDGVSLSEEALWRGEGGFFTGNPGRYVKKVSGYEHLCPWGPLSSQGEPGSRREGAYIPGTLEDE
jgi:hypothetical protein